jgi:hypothetical protein
VNRPGLHDQPDGIAITPGRQDRLRRQHRLWHGDADRHGHEHAGRAGRGRRAAPGRS